MPLVHIVKYLVVFSAGLAASLLLTRYWLRLAPRLGLIDRPGGRKMHDRPVPVGGGIAVFFGFHVACAVLFLFPWRVFSSQIGVDWWFRFLPLSTGVVLLGLIDDRAGMKPLVKFSGQVLLAVAAYALNIRVQNVLGLPMPAWVDFISTLFWFLAVMNAFNLIDGLDGLATGIALIAAVGLGVSLVFRQLPGDVLLFAGFAGACFGFLRYNYYPASVFLGDTGSLFIGFTLAALTISTSSKGTAVAAIGVPLLAVGVPLFDAVLAVWRRSVRRILHKTERTGVSVRIDQGDSDHLHHRLLRQGRRHDQVAWVLYAATALLVTVGILTTTFNSRVLGILSMAFILAVYVVFRHLVWVELWETGEMILRGISRPVRRNLSLLFYLFIDLVLLNLAWIVAAVLTALHGGAADSLNLKEMWLRMAPIDVAVPFLVLIGFRAYSRVWSLAGVLEYAAIGTALLLGGAAACTISLVRVGTTVVPFDILLHYFLMTGLALPAVVGIRAVFRLVPELMHRRKGPDAAGGQPVRALLFGEGPAVMLYLRHRATCVGRKKVFVAGIVSPDDALCGHFISGIRVLGHSQDLVALIRRERIDRLVAAGEISEEEMMVLRHAVRDGGGQLVHWGAVEKEIDL